MKGSIALSLLAAGGIALAASASAEDAPAADRRQQRPPFCAAKVQDHCIQKSDLRRKGKPITTRKAAAAHS